jgi:hypothetical protein
MGRRSLGFVIGLGVVVMLVGITYAAVQHSPLEIAWHSAQTRTLIAVMSNLLGGAGCLALLPLGIVAWQSGVEPFRRREGRWLRFWTWFVCLAWVLAYVLTIGYKFVSVPRH